MIDIRPNIRSNAAPFIDADKAVRNDLIGSGPEKIKLTLAPPSLKDVVSSSGPATGVQTTKTTGETLNTDRPAELFDRVIENKTKGIKSADADLGTSMASTINSIMASRPDAEVEKAIANTVQRQTAPIGGIVDGVSGAAASSAGGAPSDMASVLGAIEQASIGGSEQQLESLDDKSYDSPAPPSVQSKNTKRAKDSPVSTSGLVTNVTPGPSIGISKGAPKVIQGAIPTAESGRPVFSALKENRTRAEDQSGTDRPGSTVLDVITGDPEVRIEEVSVDVNRLVRMWRDPRSYLRVIMTQKMPKVDQARMLVDNVYAKKQMYKLFNRGTPLYGLVEKTVNDEATKHQRIVRAHYGSSIRIHPAISKMFTADHDGDRFKLTFDPESMAMVTKTAIDFLVSPEGILRIDPDFFGIIPLYGSIQDVTKHIGKMLSKYPATQQQLAGIAEAFPMSWRDGHAEEGLKQLVEWAVRIAENPQNRNNRDYIAGDILMRIFRMNKNIRKIELLIRGEYDLVAFTSEKYSAVKSFWSGLEVVSAEPASNDMTAGVLNAQSAGFVWGKNIPFRDAANRGKGMRIFSGIEGQDRNFRTESFLRILSLQMSEAYDFNEMYKSISTFYRAMVFDGAQYPDLNAFGAWILTFVDEFNFAALHVNSASGTIKLDKTIAASDSLFVKEIPESAEVRDQKYNALRADAIVRAFKSVYGNILMGKLFGSHCPEGYEYVSLEEFVFTNKLSSSERGSYEEGFSDVDSFIGRLADLKTSVKKKVNQSFYDAIKAQFRGNGNLVSEVSRLSSTLEILANIGKRNGIGSRSTVDVVEEAKTIISALNLLGQPVFSYLGLDNVAGFQVTELGKKFQNARGQDSFAGLVYESLASYRWAKLNKISASYDEAMGAKDFKLAERHETDFDAELDRLGSSSEAWSIIVRHYKNGVRFEGGKDIFDHLFFSDRTATDIEKIITELVRSSPYGRMDYQPYEVAADLYSDPKGEYSSNRFTADFGHRELLDDLKAAEDRMDSYAKTNWIYAQEQVGIARKFFAQKYEGLYEEPLMAYMDAIARRDPRMVRFTPSMIADAIGNALEQAYDVTEKGQSAHIFNYLYQVVGRLVNGGLWSHMDYLGDFSMGKISLDSLSSDPGTWARLLSDPNFKIKVYDSYGRRTTLTQRKLLKGPATEAKMWKFLADNPKVAMSLRIMGHTYTDRNGGKISLKAMSGLKDSMLEILDNPLNEATKSMYALADNPGFYALVSITERTLGVRRSQARPGLIEGVGKVIRFLRGLYGVGTPPSQDDIDALIDEMFKAKFGAEKAAYIDKMFDAGEAQDDKAVQLADNVKFDENYHLGQIKDSMKKYIYAYADKLYKAGIAPYAKGAMSVNEVSDLFILEDDSTKLMFFKNIESIGSIKTELSTGINGSKARKYWWSMYLSKVIPNPCDAPAPAGVDVDSFRSEWSTKYLGRNAMVGANEWVAIDSTTWMFAVEYADSTGGKVIVEDPAACTDPTCPCIRHATADQSTNHGKNQTPAFVRMLMIVRTLSSEMLNLKIKTTGTDGKDSIVKEKRFEDPLYAQTGMDIEDYLEQSYKAVYALAVEAGPTEDGTTPEAVALSRVRNILKGHLRDVLTSLGYKNEITDSDLINVAHTMIRPMTDAKTGEPTIAVLSMGEINNVAWRAIERLMARNPNATHDEAKDAALSALTNPDVIGAELDVSTIVGSINVQRNGRPYSSLTSLRESAYAPNFGLVKQIIDELGDDFQGVSEYKLDKNELELQRTFSRAFDYWSDLAGEIPDSRFHTMKNSADRWSYRVVGVWDFDNEDVDDADKVVFSYLPAIGQRNVYLVDADSSGAADAIKLAYKHGVTVLLSGPISPEMWAGVREETGLDHYQGIELSEGRIMIPMFDLRLNGKNTVINEGSSHVGVFQRNPERDLHQTVVTTYNGYDLGDSDFFTTDRFGEITHYKAGAYRVNANRAFSNLRSQISAARFAMYPGSIDQSGGTKVVTVFGTDSFTDYAKFKKVMESTDEYLAGDIAKIVARSSDRDGVLAGPDRMAKTWAAEKGIPFEPVVAKWNGFEGDVNYNAQAGSVRNNEIVNMSGVAIGFISDRRPDGNVDKMNLILNSRRENGQDINVTLINTDNGTWQRNGELIGDEVVDEDGTSSLSPSEHPAFFDAEVKRYGIPECTIPDKTSVMTDIVAPYRQKRYSDIRFDLGTSDVREGSLAETRFVENMARFISRADEMNEAGWLSSAEPGEIIGFMRAEVNGEVRYHPITVFESGNDMGAPEFMDIDTVSYDADTGEVVIGWVHEGNMEGRYAKVFEQNAASVKLMGRGVSVGRVTLQDGSEIIGGSYSASTKSRRLHNERNMKLISLIIKARIGKWGYNLAESDGILDDELDADGNAYLKEAVLTGNSQLSIWKDRLDSNPDPIQFTDDVELNNLLNSITQKCIRSGVDPTVFFASHHGGVPNYMWFDFQVVFQNTGDFYSAMLRLMHLMNPTLCPDGIYDASGKDTFFDRNLQVKLPIRTRSGKVTGHEMVDLYIGWHFFDEHYYGFSGSGVSSPSWGPADLPTRAGGGGYMSSQVMNFGNLWAGGIDFDGIHRLITQSVDRRDAGSPGKYGPPTGNSQE